MATGVYVQSAGVKNDLEIDGFAVAVCAGDRGGAVAPPGAQSFDEMEEWGDDLSALRSGRGAVARPASAGRWT